MEHAQNFKTPVYRMLLPEYFIWLFIFSLFMVEALIVIDMIEGYMEDTDNPKNN